MSKTKLKLSKIIREIVQQEVEKQLVEIFGEQKPTKAQDAQNEMIKRFSSEEISYTNNASLNEALNATANDSEFKTMKKFNSSDARSQFMQMQGGAPSADDMIPRDLAHKQIDSATEKALTRDYSDLMKAINKKRNK